PHLHYEILRHNRQVNPLRVKMPSGTKLRDKELARFTAVRAKTTNIYGTTSRTTKVADSARRQGK
ncbi:MAG: M23 family peptidase, partial [Rhodospirillales bacterium]|nr:M23 family peptidase [Rhodospirillales bacterium]